MSSVSDQINLLGIEETSDSLSLRRDLTKALTNKTIPFIDSWVTGVYNGDHARWKHLLATNSKPGSGVTGVIISAMAIYLGSYIYIFFKTISHIKLVTNILNYKRGACH